MINAFPGLPFETIFNLYKSFSFSFRVLFFITNFVLLSFNVENFSTLHLDLIVSRTFDLLLEIKNIKQF